MKRFPITAALALLASLSMVQGARSDVTVFDADKAHSEVGFNVRHFFNKVHGRFNDYTLKLAFDPNNIAASTVETVIRDTSIYTGNDRRDQHLRTQDFFWNEKYPNITFKSSKVIPGKDANHFQVAGDLTIRDVTKPDTLNVEYLGSGKIGGKGRAGMQAGFIASTTVNRKDFGIVWNRTFDEGGVMLGDDVEIVLNIAAMTPMDRPAGPPPTPTADKK